MTPTDAIPNGGRSSWRHNVRRSDVIMAAGLCAVALMLIGPALQKSRFQARLTACQDNLRSLGQAITEYGDLHDGYFPVVPSQGNLAVAGIFAPMLVDSKLLSDARRLVCPDSSLADKTDFAIPTMTAIAAASGEQLDALHHTMGGSYGYNLGYIDHGVHRGIRNQDREQFALIADAPSSDRPGFQTHNHGGQGQNVWYEDGHVRFVASPKLDGVIDDIFANDNGEVAAGIHGNDSVIAPSFVSPLPVIIVDELD